MSDFSVSDASRPSTSLAAMPKVSRSAPKLAQRFKSPPMRKRSSGLRDGHTDPGESSTEERQYPPSARVNWSEGLCYMEAIGKEAGAVEGEDAPEGSRSAPALMVQQFVGERRQPTSVPVEAELL